MSVAVHERDVDVSKLVLDPVNRRLRSKRIDGSITDASVERTIDGASTLSITLHDPDRSLLRSGIFTSAIDVRLDRLFFRLAQVTKQGDSLTLTFEDRPVALLRTYKTPKKASRSNVTRAEFALSLVREVREFGGIEFVCPELHVEQKIAPIETDAQAKTDVARTSSASPGLSRQTADLTVSGSPANASQIANAERALDVAQSVGADERVCIALIEACIVESGIQNLNRGDKDSLGILQVRTSTAGPMGIDNRDVAACVNAFLTRGFYSGTALGGGGAIAIARRNPNATPGMIAQATQGSAFPQRYEQHRAEADRFIAAYTGGAIPSSGTVTATRALPYQFQRGGTDGEEEDSWAALQRLASDVNWRCFISAGAVWFISETELLKAKPRLVLDEYTRGVQTIDFDIDAGKPIDDVTITARADRWVAAPGAVVVLGDRMGPAAGRWLVSDIQRGLYDANATITLKRPSEPLPEPAPETQTVSTPTTLAARTGAASPASLTSGSPKEIIDTVVVPIAREHSMVTGIDPAAIAAANARHGATVSGGRSDHQGPPLVAWASDMSDGSSPTPHMDALAADLARTFGLSWSGSGIVQTTRAGYRFQMIYRSNVGGNHYNHVHFGVRRETGGGNIFNV